MEKNTEDKGGDCYEIDTVNDNVTKDDDDCYEIDTVNFCPKLNINVSKDVVLVAERGPVALKDFPHPRYLCCKFPFATTSHESYCSMCFCCVCEIAAPCLQWEGFNGHCNVNRQKELQWGKVFPMI